MPREKAPGRIDSGVMSAEPAGIIRHHATLLDLVGRAPAPGMRGRSFPRPRGEARIVVQEAGRGGFSQRVAVIEADGRSLIQHGGQIPRRW